MVTTCEDTDVMCVEGELVKNLFMVNITSCGLTCFKCPSSGGALKCPSSGGYSKVSLLWGVL